MPPLVLPDRDMRSYISSLSRAMAKIYHLRSRVILGKLFQRCFFRGCDLAN